jgi:carbamoyl-phosphate synthase small subunit
MKYQTKQTAYLVLEDGSVFKGNAVGKIGTTTGEICFNTGMTGYQEIYTDPSYTGQIIINTTSHIGNYGTFVGDTESSSIKFSGLVCKSYSQMYSRLDGTQSLNDYFLEAGIVGISDVDTRQIVRHIRSTGAMNAVISSEILNEDELKALVKKVPSMDGLELSSRVATETKYVLGENNTGFEIAVLDLGCKTGILDNFVSRNCKVTVYPAKTTFAEMMKSKPDGFFISNGPGDPSATVYAIDTVKEILASNIPTFGICLGHQIIALACGLKTFKMHHGHRGLNHPVKNLLTGKSEITSQNHGFAVSMEDVEKSDFVELTHINLNDKSVEGIRLKNKPVFSVQHHPEANPGPHDSRYLFDDFIALLTINK